MTTDDFAHVGVFVIAMIGFTLGTGFFGAIISFDDPDKIPIAAWVVGMFVYGMTVMFMWG